MRFGGRRAGPALKLRYVVKTIEQLARETAPCHLQTPPFFRCQRTPDRACFRAVSGSARNSGPSHLLEPLADGGRAARCREQRIAVYVIKLD